LIAPCSAQVEFLQKRADDKKREELDEAQRMDARMRELLETEQQLLESLHSHKEEQHQARPSPPRHRIVGADRVNGPRATRDARRRARGRIRARTCA
jgi:hypothetical protein